MTAKFKVGDEVTVPNGRRGRVVKVTTTYTLQFHDEDTWNGLPWYDNELERYVRPLAVGDRVRRTDNDRTGTLKAVHGHEACYLADSGCGLVVVTLANLERIPTEAGK